MIKQNENQFNKKFRFLHSQESSEDISWSYSDSSDYEQDNVQYRTLRNITNRRKRKRGNKNKVLRNISNLDINILDTSRERNNSVISVKSPILVGKSRFGFMPVSPIIMTAFQSTSTTNNQRKFNDSASSYNYLNVSTYQPSVLKSPVLQFKNNSTKVSPKVRKKLFKGENCHSKKHKEDIQSGRCTSPILSNKKRILDKRKYKHTNNNDKEEKKSFEDHESKHNVIDRINNSSEHDESIEYSSSQESGPKKELVAKVKSFFDNHFASEASQISISEIETPTPRSNSKSSNDIETTPKTQEINVALSKVPSTNTFESDISVQKKKVKYKKGGLSDRLNVLLKKQNSSVYLWQHERFLAANSNFVIPKQQFLVYRIKSICFKYGIYLLEIINKNDEFLIAVINSLYVNNNVFEIDSIIKIYEPFKIVNIQNNCKIICNVCKFECDKLML